jgi:hypothetical protein|tara:strand:+ start:274 stop:588 length:315 start_codon:yes stop_codon:yes gene_type:complete
MAFPKKLSQLCAPAAFYFVISMFAFTIMVIQNLGNKKTFKLGLFSCRVANTLLVLAFNLIYILFFTYVLNLICKDGYTSISWFLVLFPFIFLFVILGLMIISDK